MTLINGLKNELKDEGLEPKYTVHNSKGFIEKILDDAFVVNLQKATIKDKNGKIVCKANLSHGYLKICPEIPELDFLKFKGWII